MNWYKYSQSHEPLRLIKPTREESAIFSMIRQARDRFAPGTSLRVAGGWVRDRLIGKLSDDIDIAVSGGDGVAIADAVSKFDRETHGGRTGTSYAVSLEKGGESSGLKVGAVDIDGVKIEFVPMRTENYREDSRVPSIVPTDDHREDARRRDLTINAIYYNLDTGEVEDPTGGAGDLYHGLLRTPVDPLVTLVEDPLRAVRALRFLSKMDGFRLDPKLEDALAHPEVHQAWERKVASERVRKELEGIAKGSNPADAFKIMLQSGLYLPMFGRDRFDGFKPFTMDQNNPHHDLNLLDHTVEVVRNMNELMKKEGYGERERMLAVLASLFHDFGKMHPDVERPSKSTPGASSYPGHEDVSAEMAESILKSLGFGAERGVIAKIVKEHMRPHGSLETPKAMGRFVRDFESMKTDDPVKGRLWHMTMLHGMADASAKGRGADPEEIAAKRRKMDEIGSMLQSRPGERGKPMLSGRDIMTLFPQMDPKTGFIRTMTEALEGAVDSGEVVDEASAREFLKSTFSKGASSADVDDMEKRANLGRWFKEKWVDISRKKDGKHPPCGRSDASSGAYPKCRPSKKVSEDTPSTSRGMSAAEKRKATEQKRRAESKPRKGKSPHRVSHHDLKKKSSGEEPDA
jgi:tRNA nucleotidyltransferase/poly(A) polymerase